MLVCRIWKTIVEGTPSFWTLIKAADGLQHARNAITKTGDSPIDLTLYLEDPVSLDQFLAVVSEKVSCWRSVELATDGAFPVSFCGLQASEWSSLEKISLAWDESSHTTSPLTLFGGGPAPDGLKDVYFRGIPAELAPMQLSKLSYLALIDVPYIKMDDLLLILRNSPALTTLHLLDRGSLHPLGGSVELPIILGSLAVCTFEVSTPFIPFLLSVIHAPSLDRLDLTFDTEDSVPDSWIFSPAALAFEPTLRKLLSNAKRIEIEFGDPYIAITFGGLEILLDSSGVEGFQYLRDVLDSLMYYSGEKGEDLKIRLELAAVDPTLEKLQIFNRAPMVEQLVLTEESWAELAPTNAIEALGTRLAADPYGWLFPELEVLDWNMNMGNIGKLETALEKRHCAPQLTRQGYADERKHPRSLKELRFFSIGSTEAVSVDVEAARRFHVLAGGAKVFVRNALVDFGAPGSE
ncbi:hypothetical protein FRC00_000433 [Tulasnella sp. 408]|nr:hypothetical protein FRC00_000433 [Tulasnella sp. 408]